MEGLFPGLVYEYLATEEAGQSVFFFFFLAFILWDGMCVGLYVSNLGPAPAGSGMPCACSVGGEAPCVSGDCRRLAWAGGEQHRG